MSDYTKLPRNAAGVPFIPGKEPPPVDKRPQCPNCGERLRPWIEGGHLRTTLEGGGVEPRHWEGQYHAYGAFCSLRCGCAFGNAAVKAGYRGAFPVR